MSERTDLQGRHILLGLTGGVAVDVLLPVAVLVALTIAVRVAVLLPVDVLVAL